MSNDVLPPEVDAQFQKTAEQIAHERLFAVVLKNGERFDLDRAIVNDITFDQILFWGKARRVSDFSFRTGDYVRGLTGKGWRRISSRPIKPNELEDILRTIISETATSSMRNGHELAQSYMPKERVEIDDERVSGPNGRKATHVVTHRFRFSGTCIKSPISDDIGFALVLRSLPALPPTVKELGIEAEILKHWVKTNSANFITGGTGSGKSTLIYSILADMIYQDIANEDLPEHLKTPENIKPDDWEPRGLHILDYSAPIEYTLDRLIMSESFLSQTDVSFMLRDPDNRTESATWSYAVRNALRRKPDGILIAETRDRATIDAMVTAANTGHQAYTTMHNNSVVSCFQRILRFYPKDERLGLATDLIGYLNIIVNQQLIPKSSGGKVAIREYLIVNDYVRNRLLAVEEVESWPNLVHQIMVENSEVENPQCVCRLKMHHARQRFNEGDITEEVYESIVRQTSDMVASTKIVGEHMPSDPMPRSFLEPDAYRPIDRGESDGEEK